MNKPLNLSTEQRIGCQVTFNVNQFEVYASAGWMMFSAYTKADLKIMLSQNQISGAMFDGIAQRMYLANV